jgi:deoxyribodipyrimidine photo-lyase
VWVTSDKREYAARTIRPKVHKNLPIFLEEFPELPTMKEWPDKARPIDWDGVIARVLEAGMLDVRAVDLMQRVLWQL